MTDKKHGEREAERRAKRPRAALRENLKRRKAQARAREQSRRPDFRVRQRCPGKAQGLAFGGLTSAGAGAWIGYASSAADGLKGSIPISGAKNATLPLMIASMLTDQTLILDNVPRLADVGLLQRILSNHGVDMMVPGKRPGETQQNGHTLHIVASRIVDTTAPYDLVSKMRASFWVIAPLLARMGEAKVSLPGGCAIGTRPVDLLIMALEKLGAQIDIEAAT